MNSDRSDKNLERTNSNKNKEKSPLVKFESSQSVNSTNKMIDQEKPQKLYLKSMEQPADD